MKVFRFYDIEWNIVDDVEFNDPSFDLPTEFEVKSINNWFNPDKDGENYIDNHYSASAKSFKWEIIDDVPDVGLIKIS